MDNVQIAKLFFNKSDDLLFVVKVEGVQPPFSFHLLTMNPSCLRYIGKTEEAFGQTLQEIVSPEATSFMEKQLALAIHSKQPVVCEITDSSRNDGKVFEVTLTPLFDEFDRPSHILGAGKDVTERKRYERYIRESEERYRTLVQLSPDTIIIHDEGKIVFCNEAAAKLVQANHPEELLGSNLLDYIPPEFRRSAELRLKRIYNDSSGKLEQVPFELKMLKRNGEVIDIEVTYAFIEYNGKKALQIIGRDITKRSMEKKRLQRLSQLDSLTNIANRRTFDNVLQREVNRARRNKHPVALILFDIDNFKMYNDYYGHLAGDECIKQVTAAAKLVIKRPGDLLARFGGEEFAVLLPETDGYGAMTVAENLREAVEKLGIPHPESNVLPVVTISLGVSCMNRPSMKEIVSFVNRADQALYIAKHKGKNRVELNA